MKTGSRDDLKFRILLFLAALCIFGIFSINLTGADSGMDLLEYIKRRYYFEKVISPRGLEPHEALHWRKKESER